MDIFDIIFAECGEIEDGAFEMEPDLERPDLSNLANGEEFELRGIRFVKLGIEQGGILCITKDAYHYAAFNNEDQHNNYAESNVRKWILEEFQHNLDGVELLPYTMDLKPYYGESRYEPCTDPVGLLTFELYQKYRDIIPKCGKMVWLCSPYSCERREKYVMYVNSSGHVSDGGAYGAGRCRPACIFPI